MTTETAGLPPAPAREPAGPGVQPAPVRRAVFDLDGTLHPGTSGLALLSEIAAGGACDPGKAQDVFDFLGERGPGELHTPAAAERAYHLYGQALAGVQVQQVRHAARRVWGQMRHELFPYVRPLLAAVRAYSYEIIVISGSPHEIVDVVAEDLGFDRSQGAVLATRGGCYSGAVTLASGVPGAKTRILAALTGSRTPDLGGQRQCDHGVAALPEAQVPGSLAASPAVSIAVGNSAADIDLLHMAGNAIAFEPSAPLATAAARFGWPVTGRHDVADRLLRLISQQVGNGQ